MCVCVVRAATGTTPLGQSLLLNLSQDHPLPAARRAPGPTALSHCADGETEAPQRGETCPGDPPRQAALCEAPDFVFFLKEKNRNCSAH